MNLNHELIGTVVHVHRDVNCLLSKQNHVGVISEADVASDDFYVNFEDRLTGIYGADALTTLLPTDLLRKNKQVQKSLPKDILNSITSIVENDEVMGKTDFMRFLLAHPEALKFFTRSLQEHIAESISSQNHRAIF